MIATVLLLAVGFIGVMWIGEWRPAPVEVLADNPNAAPFAGDTIKIVSWNIGYAGLGDDMDFFYDGGTRMRTTAERTGENLAGIVAFLEQHTDADIILLQEVDMDSHRSYNVDQYEAIRSALPEYPFAYFAPNYRSAFVPIPLRSPMGGVRSGLALFSKTEPVEVIRYQYPGAFAFPVRLFNLKRALLSLSFRMEGVAEPLYINNTHNSAYDDGGMRRGELRFLDSLLSGKPYTVTMGDWNSNPPGYHPSAAEQTDPYFRPLILQKEDFSAGLHFAADTLHYSTRYGYEPFRAGHTTQTLLDFALLSPRIRTLSVEVVDLGYRNSDHNPVVGCFLIER